MNRIIDSRHRGLSLLPVTSRFLTVKATRRLALGCCWIAVFLREQRYMVSGTRFTWANDGNKLLTPFEITRRGSQSAWIWRCLSPDGMCWAHTFTDCFIITNSVGRFCTAAAKKQSFLAGLDPFQ